MRWNLKEAGCGEPANPRANLWSDRQKPYRSYKKFFQDIGRPEALYFFERYPPTANMTGKTSGELAEELRPVSHNNCSVKLAEKILEMIKADRTSRDC